MIRCVIVEDEEIARKVLKSLLAQYCQDVMVCAEADDIISGKAMIESFRPDLVFLDIEMPGGSGFKLLSSVDNADFEVNADEAGTVPENRCYTVEDLEAILMISKRSVYNLLKKKEFRWIRVGRSGYRISRKSFDEWLNHTA